jgi:hypothetical protein
MTRTRTTTLTAATALAAAVVLALAPGTATAHEGTAEQLRKTAALRAAAPGIPTVTSDNITQLSGLPETTAISMEFARTGAFAYVSSLDTISVLDLEDPRNPVLRGTLVNALFENESMTYGERMIDGELQRFVIAAVDIVQVSPGDPTHVNAGDGLEVVLVDVTDPDAPTIRSRTPMTGDNRVTTSTHTVQCVDQADCRYAYTAGTGSLFSIVDLTDLDAPRQLKTMPSPASGPGQDGFAGGAGHYWDFDGELGWHTGSGGAAAFDVSDPVNPVIVTATNEKGRGAPINDFILHNSMRPNASAFRSGAAPSIANGNVLLVTEEDYADGGDELVCSEAGSFQTWHVPDLDGAAYRSRNATGKVQDVGTVVPLDQVNAPSDFGGGLSTPASGFCSAHWFDVHQDGFVALGHYGAGMRVLDVRDARDIKQYGFVTGLATQVWDAYWVPQRDAAGVAVPGMKTNLVYTADAVRGIEVYEVTLPAVTTPPGEQPPPAQPPAQQPPAAQPPGGSLAATGPTVLLPLAAALLLGTALVVRRRSAH